MGSVRPAPAAAAPPTTSAATWRFCTGCLDKGGDLSRYRYVGLNAWQSGSIPALKQANPALKAFVYKDMASTRSSSCGGAIPAGIDYCWADQQHPDWFTRDGTGSRIQWAGFSGHWQMDVGNGAYQDQWAANVIADLKANHWDGVVIDNANVDESGYLGGRSMAEYPTQPSYQAATRSFLANVCPKVIAAGFLCLPNIQAQPVLANARLWTDWIQFTSGGTREYWTKWDYDAGGQFGDGGWNDLQDVFAAVQGAGKIFLPVTYAPMSDTRSIRYARASFLLRWNGGPSAFIFAPTPEDRDPWSPEWTTDIGTPTAAAAQVGAAWRRSFSGGVVAVNPSSTSSATVQLGGSYLAPDGAAVTSVNLSPLSGMIVRTSGAVPPPSPPTPPTQPSISLTLRPFGSNGLELRWTGATTRTVDVFRDGARIATVSNSGSYRDRARKGAAATYKVCEASSSGCSADVSVNTRNLASVRAAQPRLSQGHFAQRRVAKRAAGVWRILRLGR